LGSTMLWGRQPQARPNVQAERQPQNFRPYKSVHVLTIGINKYRSPKYPTLVAAESDATTVKAVFRDLYKYEIDEPLLGARATKAAIISALNNYQRTLGEDDV